MKIGKIIAIMFGLVSLGAIVFVMNSMPKKVAINTGPKTEIKKEYNKTAQIENSLKRQEDEERQKLEKLSLEKANLERKEQFKGVSNLYRVSCAPCHGLDGRGEIAPIITGKTKEELLSKLILFKNHDINNTLMTGLLQNLSEEKLNSLSDEISRFK